MACCPGSSPLARGLRQILHELDEAARIIPARAGFTVVIMIVAAEYWDHPRSRGVYNGGRPSLSRTLGSSPLARGLRRLTLEPAAGSGIIPARAGFTLHGRRTGFVIRDHPRSRGVYEKPALALEAEARIIPARAGFTRNRNAFRVRAWDHPRSRGVYHSIHHCRPADRGSSPLARGLLAKQTRRSCRAGIIPARAGFTQSKP